MQPGQPPPGVDAAVGLGGTAQPPRASGGPTALRLASAVMFVHDLDESVAFYEELLTWEVTVRNTAVALLVGPDGFQLYLRGRGRGAGHPLGQVGIQYLMWTADGEDELRRCEAVLRSRSAQVTTTTTDGFTVVEGVGPNRVPIFVTFPGPDVARRHEIMDRVYGW